jgi:hypothetical protein
VATLGLLYPLELRMKQSEEPVEEAVTTREGHRSKSPGQPPPEVGNLSAERVDER